ncbi:MAG: transposase [Deferrisomatales bacterium]|nr:transposase [Deferrisomatales bacterium]
MPRIPRFLVQGESATYHVVSRSALPGFVLGDWEKEHLTKLLLRLARVYFVEVLGFCWMGSHVHLVLRMHTGAGVSDQEVRQRFRLYYGESEEAKRELLDGQIPFYRAKWESLSELVKDFKQSFSRWFNKTHGRRGYFWGERFKSVLVENGDTLINVLAYVDLNPVRAGLVNRPEDYRWSSLGYHLQAGNPEGLLSLDLGLAPFGALNEGQRLRAYRKYVYQVGSLAGDKGAGIPEEVVQREEERGYEIGAAHRLSCRIRYFTDSGVIGTQAFVAACCRRFGGHPAQRRDRRPHRVPDLDGVFSLKRLRRPA